MVRGLKIKVYNFKELSTEAKENAIQNAVNNGWLDFDTDDIIDSIKRLNWDLTDYSVDLIYGGRDDFFEFSSKVTNGMINDYLKNYVETEWDDFFIRKALEKCKEYSSVDNGTFELDFTREIVRLTNKHFDYVINDMEYWGDVFFSNEREFYKNGDMYLGKL